MFFFFLFKERKKEKKISAKREKWAEGRQRRRQWDCIVLRSRFFFFFFFYLLSGCKWCLTHYDINGRQAPNLLYLTMEPSPIFFFLSFFQGSFTIVTWGTCSSDWAIGKHTHKKKWHLYNSLNNSTRRSVLFRRVLGESEEARSEQLASGDHKNIKKSVMRSSW